MKWISLIIGGALGTIARYAISGSVYEWLGSSFPYGTVAVNILGCLVIGFFAAISDEKFMLGPQARLMLMVGFCGAFTTFSTFIFETSNLVRDGENLRAFIYVAGSVVVGFWIFRLGFMIGELI